jgi:hypothetical protein
MRLFMNLLILVSGLGMGQIARSEVNSSGHDLPHCCQTCETPEAIQCRNTRDGMLCETPLQPAETEAPREQGNWAGLGTQGDQVRRRRQVARPMKIHRGKKT